MPGRAGTRAFLCASATRDYAASLSAYDVRECVLSVDVGTTALKAALLAPDGTALGVSERAYARGTTRGDSGLSGAMEQDPNDWLEAFARAARDVLSPHGDAKPAGVALSGQMQNVVLARAGASLRPCLLYSDVRAVEEAERIRRRLRSDEDAFPLSNFKGAAACLCKWLWLARHDAETLAEAETLLLGAHSFLAYALCGGDRSAAACDPTTASTTGLLATGPPSVDARWATETCGGFPGIDPVLLPKLTIGFAPPPLGAIAPETADTLQVPKNLVRVPVFHGVGDLASTTVGAVGVGADGGAGYAYCGTSGWIARARARGGADFANGEAASSTTSTSTTNGSEIKQNPLSTTFTLLHPDPKLEIVAASMVTAGGNVEWARRALFADGAEPSPKAFDAAAAAAPPGSEGVLFLPHLNGERSPFTDATARGCFVNLSPATTKAHMCRAVLEGVAYNYRALADALAPPLDESEPMPFLGGGANSPLWTQILADATRRPLAPLPDASTVAARGCAAGAFERLGLWGPPAGAEGEGGRAAPPAGYFPRGGDGGEAFAPDADAAATHDENYAVWRKLHDALAGAGAGSLV